ncbi:MAG: adenylosuccinate lyase [Candidatus Omnitrophica bacterium]|nr:adenylosuccinate lyase [Candidatus Omnitrophota bacterium]
MIERYSLPGMKHIWEEENKFRIMRDIEVLACEVLSRQKKMPLSSYRRIKRRAKFNLKTIQRLERKTHHDIVAFVTNLAQNLGKDAQYLHLGMTSSDLLDTTLSVQLRQATDILIQDLSKLLKVISRQAKRYKDTVCIGRTHGIHAEPTTFGVKLALWYDESKRNLRRLIAASKNVAVGKISGAVGTYANIEPGVEQYVLRKLKLKPIASTQIISRDVYAELLLTLSLIASSLEKFATEIRHLQRTEVQEVGEPFSRGQKGSSAMPHKRNPVICERICGLARILRGNSRVALENISLWHERDISHSSAERIIFPDSCLALDYMFNKMIEVIEKLVVYPENMLANVVKTHGLIFSQRVMLELIQKGMVRIRAYDLVQRCAMRSWQDKQDFKEMLLEDKEVLRYLDAQELEKVFNLNYYLRNINKIFRKVGL